MQVIIERDELYQLMKKAVRDVIREEYSALRLNFLDYVSDEEMADIIGTHGKPDALVKETNMRGKIIRSLKQRLIE
jgi:hypothetical protein